MEQKSTKKHYSFANNNYKKDLDLCYSFRFTETPDFKQASDHITTTVNEQHREGYDNISLITKETYKLGVKAKLTCSFDNLGCPEIIFVKKPELCNDNVVRYGECFEVVLWKNGVNVWRHYMTDDHRCSWHKRLGLSTSVSEKDLHVLEVEIDKNTIIFSVDGIKVELRAEDFFEEFYVGVTACEGIVRLYDFEIEK
jgi:hypothetical protein